MRNKRFSSIKVNELMSLQYVFIHIQLLLSIIMVVNYLMFPDNILMLAFFSFYHGQKTKAIISSFTNTVAFIYIYIYSDSLQSMISAAVLASLSKNMYGLLLDNLVEKMLCITNIFISTELIVCCLTMNNLC